MCTFPHAVRKQQNQGENEKNALFYVLFWVAKMNNHILTTQNTNPILQIANK